MMYKDMNNGSFFSWLSKDIMFKKKKLIWFKLFTTAETKKEVKSSHDNERHKFTIINKNNKYNFKEIIFFFTKKTFIYK